MYETACYYLHLIDRSLSDVARRDPREKFLNYVMNELVSALCREFNDNYAIINISSDEARSLFIRLYNCRQAEYGSCGDEDWFNRANSGYGVHAAEALKLPEGNKCAFAMKSSLGALEIFTRILPDIDPIYDLAKRNR